MPPVTAARNAVALTFALNGLCFATLVSRIPDLRSGLGLDNGELGLLLLAIAAGSVLALPSSGRIIERIGAAGVVRLGAVLTAVGLGDARWGSRPWTRWRRPRRGSSPTGSGPVSGTWP